MIFVGMFLLLVGIFMLLERAGFIPIHAGSYLLPVALIALGISLVFDRKRKIRK